MKKWLWRLGVVAAIGLALSSAGRLFRRPPVEVKAVTVARGPVRDVVTSSTAGEVVAEKRATVRAELPARVIAVKHRRGDRVKRGEPIVSLDAADLEARLGQARASLSAALAQFDQAKARVTTLERQAQRAHTLADRGAGTAQVSEDADNLLKESREAVRAQAGALAQAQAAVQVAQVARTKADLAAPFDGLLVDVFPDPGEALQPGAPAFEIIDDRRLHVDATVDEADAARVRPGQEAQLTLDALPGRTIAGRVSLVAPAVKRDLKGARTLPIEVEVVDPLAAAGIGLKVGMSANVEMVVAEKQGVLYLPTNAIIGRGAKRTVYKLVADEPLHADRATLTAVEVGLGNWDRTEVVAGLALGERAVSSLSVKGLEDGAAVKVAP